MNKPEAPDQSLAAAEQRLDDARDVYAAATKVNDPVILAYVLNLLVGRAEEWVKLLREFREAEGMYR